MSFHSAFVLGFHGCAAQTAGAILSGKSTHLRASHNLYDWLGNGIYFWEVSAVRAKAWADESVKRRSAKDPAPRPTVLGTVIDLGNCLDLLDAQNFDLVRDAYQGLRNFLNSSGLPMPENRSLAGRSEKVLRNLDCSVINYIHELRTTKGLPAFDTVRAVFTEGQPLYEDGSFLDKNHVQICVRNTRCIKGYFRPILPSEA